MCACGKDNTSVASKDGTSSSQTGVVVYPPNAAKPPLTNLPSTVYPEDAEVEKAHFETFEDDPYTHQLVRYELNDECKGYYATPKAKGEYPTVVTKCVDPSTWGGHSLELAQREIFMYLYFATVGHVPSLEYAASICNNPDEYTLFIPKKHINKITGENGYEKVFSTVTVNNLNNFVGCLR